METAAAVMKKKYLIIKASILIPEHIQSSHSLTPIPWTHSPR